MLDFVQLVSDHSVPAVGFDEDSMHWVGVAVRESVINAIKHGNQNDASKMVHVEFRSTSDAGGSWSSASATRAKASSPREVADPLAPENMLKSSGRGIFLIRNFMDDVDAAAAARGRHGSADGEEARPDRSLTCPR